MAQFTGGACHSLGTGDGRLRYADGSLTLSYDLGETCHSNYARTSAITFLCPRDVDRNTTGVSFLGEDNCHYEFEWVTSLGCGAEASGTSACQFDLAGRGYNFAPLVGSADKNWVAVSADGGTACFLLNPCGEVATTAAAAKTSAELCQSRLAPAASCSGTSVCQVLKNGTGVRIGRFDLRNATSVVSVDSSIVTVIGEGDASHKAVVHYVCKPGDLTSPPVYINRTNDAYYEFHWTTSAACPRGVQTGENCLVSDIVTGFTFNLTALKPYKYRLPGADYDYELAVCGDLNGTDCPPHTAFCQISDSTGAAKSLGAANASLMYADGTLKLLYTGGDKCLKWPHRNSTVLFQCDSSAHSPSVYRVFEHYCQYTVEVRTKLACPPAYRATECTLVVGNETLDLSELSRETGNWQAAGPDSSVYYINLCRPLNHVPGCGPLAAACRAKSVGGKTTYTNIGLASTAKLTQRLSLFAVGKNQVVLSYSFSNPAAAAAGSQGSECKTTHTNIVFSCDPNADEEVRTREREGGRGE